LFHEREREQALEEYRSGEQVRAEDTTLFPGEGDRRVVAELEARLSVVEKQLNALLLQKR
jgi:hypothetical protein